MTFLFFLPISIFGNDNEPQVKEFWQQIYAYRSFSEKITGQLLFNNLYSQKLGNYDWFVQGKMSFHARHWLDLELLYRQEFYKVNKITLQEYRPMFRAVAKKQLGNWKFRNRQRMEYRMFEVGESHFRYRTDLKIKPDWNLTSLNINPYLTEEIFVSREKLSRNRMYGGFEAQKGRFEPAVYALVQSDKLADKWHSRLILGLVFGLRI